MTHTLLFEAATLRPAASGYFFSHLLPWAVGHILIFLLIWKLTGRRARAVIVFWSLSAAAILAAGGTTAIFVFLAVLVFGLVLTGIGDGIARWLLDESHQSWGLSLGLGIAAASVVGAYLAVFHLFTPWAVGLVLLLGLIPLSRRERGGVRGRGFGTDPARPGVGVLSPAISFVILSAAKNLLPRARQILHFVQDDRRQPFRASLADRERSVVALSEALTFEAAFLFGVFAWVGACAPEGRTDAMRVYWPYVRLLEHFRGFFDLPYQWTFIAPQAGVAYAGSLYLLFGARTVRYAMLLALTALAAIVWSVTLSRRERGGVRAAPSSASAAVALLVASCPLILGMALSLMQDTFVCLAVFLLALVCIEGDEAGSGRFWAGAGALTGLALTAKYTTVVYVLPLLGWAAYRSWRAVRAGRTLKGLIIAEGAALGTSGPWLWHAYRQSGDPFFPFLTRIFPSPLWPFGLGTANLQAVPGSRRWVTWPSDVSHAASGFAEWLPGNLGITVPVLLALSIPLLFIKRFRSSRPWILSAILGTALLWTQTGYARYWLPGIWLLAAPAAAAAIALARSRGARIGLAAAIPLVLALHLPMEMNHAWFDPVGWPWDYYSGAINDEAYYRRSAGFEALRRLDSSDGSWPRVWCTGLLQLGDLRVVPLQAAEWEIHLHGAFTADAAAKFLRSAGCEYWIVDRASPACDFFRKLGLDHEFWTPERAFASEGNVTIYRMR